MVTSRWFRILFSLEPFRPWGICRARHKLSLLGTLGSTMEPIHPAPSDTRTGRQVRPGMSTGRPKGNATST